NRVVWLRVVLHDQLDLGVHLPRNYDFLSPGYARCHPDRGSGRLCAVIERAAQYIHVEQLTHQTAVLEESLPLSVVSIRLAHVRGQELPSPVYFVAHGWNEVLRATRSQKVQVVLAVLVLFQKTFDVSLYRVLADYGRGEPQLSLESQAFRYLDIEVHHVPSAHLPQHLRLDFRNGIWYVRKNCPSLTHGPSV